MKTPDIPEDEEIRLTTLEMLNILDTQPEERFDRLTRMAKRIFGVPIALVSLVDENRQWFKSCIGLDVTETPRDISFCGHAILGSEIFIIPDATKDERFADNPLVTSDPNIRFYAGYPLTAPNGSRVGTLCIIDNTPRNLNNDDLETLKDLGSMAEQEIANLQLATIDDLTGILNRRGFNILGNSSLQYFTRQRIKASLVFFDLNEFKPINDKYGHAEGDRALVAFADIMKGIFRDSDVFARIGGDEFVVLLSSTSKEKAEEIISRSGRVLDEYNQQANRGYNISFSHGIVEFNPDLNQTLESLLAEGDELMYKLKKNNSR